MSKMSRQAEMSQVVICFLVFGSIYEVFRQEKLGMQCLCIKQSFFSFIIPYLVLVRDRHWGMIFGAIWGQAHSTEFI